MSNLATNVLAPSFIHNYDDVNDDGLGEVNEENWDDVNDREIRKRNEEAIQNAKKVWPTVLQPLLILTINTMLTELRGFLTEVNRVSIVKMTAQDTIYWKSNGGINIERTTKKFLEKETAKNRSFVANYFCCPVDFSELWNEYNTNRINAFLYSMRIQIDRDEYNKSLDYWEHHRVCGYHDTELITTNIITHISTYGWYRNFDFYFEKLNTDQKNKVLDKICERIGRCLCGTFHKNAYSISCLHALLLKHGSLSRIAAVIRESGDGTPFLKAVLEHTSLLYRLEDVMKMVQDNNYYQSEVLRLVFLRIQCLSKMSEQEYWLNYGWNRTGINP